MDHDATRDIQEFVQERTASRFLRHWSLKSPPTWTPK
jgi:hypothetical protein